MPLLVIVAIGIWFLVGDPQKNVANWLYGSEPAPWETVDAFYYPNRYDLSFVQTMMNLDTVEACRDWVYAAAEQNNDSSIERGDYECGVGLLDTFNGLSVYRINLR